MFRVCHADDEAWDYGEAWVDVTTASVRKCAPKAVLSEAAASGSLVSRDALWPWRPDHEAAMAVKCSARTPPIYANFLSLAELRQTRKGWFIQSAMQQSKVNFSECGSRPRQ